MHPMHMPDLLSIQYTPKTIELIQARFSITRWVLGQSQSMEEWPSHWPRPVSRDQGKSWPASRQVLEGLQLCIESAATLLGSHLPSTLSFRASSSGSRQNRVRVDLRIVPWLHHSKSNSKGENVVESDRGIGPIPLALLMGKDVPHRRWQPVLESKSLAPVPPVLSILGQLVKPQVDPSHEESKLNQNVGRRP